MKKIFTFVVAALFGMSASATDLWVASDNTHFDWGNTLNIDASSFANAVEGNKIVLTFVEDGAADVVEFKSNGQKLPGSRFTPLYDWMETCEYFLTQDAVDMLKQYGLELCGGNINITMVSLEDGKAGNMKEGKTLWTGYFWVDSWSTLEVFKEAFENIDLNTYKGMRFYSECPNTDNLIFLLANWDANGVVAKSEPATDEEAATNPLKRYEGYAELDLTQVNPLDIINSVASDRLMIQMDKQGNNPFNFTDVVLVTELTEVEEGPVCPEHLYVIGDNQGWKPAEGVEMTKEADACVFTLKNVVMPNETNYFAFTTVQTDNWDVVNANRYGSANVNILNNPTAMEMGGEPCFTLPAGTYDLAVNFEEMQAVAIEATTGIRHEINLAPATKHIENGHIVLVKNGVRYNVLGARL